MIMIVMFMMIMMMIMIRCGLYCTGSPVVSTAAGLGAEPHLQPELAVRAGHLHPHLLFTLAACHVYCLVWTTTPWSVVANR